MQTLFVVFGVIVIFLLILILSVLGGIQKSLMLYLTLTLRQGKIFDNRPLNEAKSKRSK